MLPHSLSCALGRLIESLIAIGRAATAYGTDEANPDDPAQAARTLLYRLTALIIRLVRLDNRSLPTPPAPPIAPRRPNPNRPRGIVRGPYLCFPRHPGWLLALLPDTAPALAAELRAAMSDPALASLLAAVPTLGRALHPALHALGLDASATPAPSDPPPRPPHPARRLDPTPAPRAHLPASSVSNRPCASTPSHAQSITI